MLPSSALSREQTTTYLEKFKGSVPLKYNFKGLRKKVTILENCYVANASPV